MKKYPKAFEQWWNRTTIYINYNIYVIPGMLAGIKRTTFNAWKAGRAHEKKRNQ